MGGKGQGGGGRGGGGEETGDRGVGVGDEGEFANEGKCFLDQLNV